jgi:hypothetical protein
VMQILPPFVLMRMRAAHGWFVHTACVAVIHAYIQCDAVC